MAALRTSSGVYKFKLCSTTKQFRFTTEPYSQLLSLTPFITVILHPTISSEFPRLKEEGLQKDTHVLETSPPKGVMFGFDRSSKKKPSLRQKCVLWPTEIDFGGRNKGILFPYFVCFTKFFSTYPVHIFCL